MYNNCEQVLTPVYLIDLKWSSGNKSLTDRFNKMLHEGNSSESRSTSSQLAKPFSR